MFFVKSYQNKSFIQSFAGVNNAFCALRPKRTIINFNSYFICCITLATNNITLDF
jgi:hypothetical protein